MRIEVNDLLVWHRGIRLLYSYSGGTAKAGTNQVVVIALAQWNECQTFVAHVVNHSTVVQLFEDMDYFRFF